MQIEIETGPAENLTGDALAVICYEAEEPAVNSTNGVSPGPIIDPEIVKQDGWLADLRASGEFSGKLYETVVFYRPQRVGCKRLVVIGGGKQDRFSAVEARRVAGTLVRNLKTKGIHSIGLLLEGPAAPEIVSAAVEGALIGAWEPDKYKSDPKKNHANVASFALVIPGANADEFRSAVETAKAMAAAQNVTRDLVNEPPNRLTTADLAEAARRIAAESGLEFELLDRDEMARQGMGALLGVAQGSSNPPFLAVMRYRPSHVRSGNHLALIGKGVTFDTGGISIKPADGMEKMKYDMAGAAAVIGAMQAIGRLKPTVAVAAYLPIVENMLSGNAQRPGDIVTTLSGKTVEVLNTDAEGRLILADAITYAKRNGATHIVDAATLTGAISVALGQYNAGAFTNDEAFVQRVLGAGKAAGEKIWQLPMDDDYKDYLKSAFADLPNVGGRPAGSITAAWFLREFADPTSWVHLDIAGTAWLDEGKSWISKGPTGIAVRSFIRLAMDWDAGPAQHSF
jgi:leucyl aminopeptidase